MGVHRSRRAQQLKLSALMWWPQRSMVPPVPSLFSGFAGRRMPGIGMSGVADTGAAKTQQADPSLQRGQQTKNAPPA